MVAKCVAEKQGDNVSELNGLNGSIPRNREVGLTPGKARRQPYLSIPR
jgi:hypothetical protein